MKKYIIYTLLLGLLLFSCNPNKDIYEDVKNAEEPYHEKGIEYTLVADDYKAISRAAREYALNNNEADTIWADYIYSYSSFNKVFSVNDYIPAILHSNFPVLNKGSEVTVNYNQYIGDFYGKIKNSNLRGYDYTNFGGTIAINKYFSTEEEWKTHLPNYLLDKYPDATEGEYAQVTFKFSPDKIKSGGFFKFNGTNWEYVENSYVLSQADYISMGNASGQPGFQSSFSKSIKPQNYYPQFLSNKYPYSQKNDKKIILASFSEYAAPIYAITCIFDGNNWEIIFPGLESSAQFIHTGTEWVFDPTVRFTMNKSDYQLIVDEDEYQYSGGTAGNYYGASSKYQNFDIRLAKKMEYAPEIWPPTLTEEEGNALVQERLREGLVILLQKKFPEAVPQVNGIDVHYFITYRTYDGKLKLYYEIEYKCSSSGTPPEFELVTDAVEL